MNEAHSNPENAPLPIWKERRDYFLIQLAILSDPAQRFTVQKQLEEAEAMIAKLQREVTPKTHPHLPPPKREPEAIPVPTEAAKLPLPPEDQGQPESRDALAERLRFLESWEAICPDSAMKSRLTHLIADAKSRSHEEGPRP
ncbi:MAG: hypothetical protein ACO1SV_09440 [Fimbriimonas sp.]